MTPISSAATRPADGEFAPYYGRYIALVPEGDIVATLRDHGRALHATLSALPESRGGFRYAEGKWSVREMLGHIIDAERVFAYRALRFARGDATPLAGFDENTYAVAAGSDARSLADLLDEWRCVREGTVRLLSSLPAEAWARAGTASDAHVSVRALAFIIAGHVMHHARILHERYGVPTGA